MAEALEACLARQRLRPARRAAVRAEAGAAVRHRGGDTREGDARDHPRAEDLAVLVRVVAAVRLEPEERRVRTEEGVDGGISAETAEEKEEAEEAIVSVLVSVRS